MRNNVAFIGNDAANEGGGVYAKGGTFDITNCTLKGNKAKNGGGVYAEKFKTRPGVTPPRESPSTVTIKGGVIGGTDAADANKATGTGTDGGGGGIYIGEDCTLTMQDNAKIIGNAAAQSGGAIFAAGATVNLTLCSLTGNKAEENGGAIYAIKETVASTVTITGGAIGGMGAGEANVVTNDYGFGGGIYINTGCTLTLNEYVSGGSRQGVQISGNKAWRGGGVRANDSTVSMTGCTIRSNMAEGSTDAGGGGVYTYGGTLSMTSCALTGNTAATNGGGLNIEKGSATLTRCTFTGNKAEENGGAIYTKKIDGVASTVTIKGGAIGGAAATDANKATGSGAGKGMGGGIYVGDGCALTLQESAGSGGQGVRIVGNQAKESGGGAYVENSSATFAINGSSVVTPPTDGDANKAGKNDVYLNSGAMITVAGALTPPGGIAARITVPDDKYSTSTQVLDTAGTGINLSNETGKFTVTPKGSEYWIVKNDGYLTNNITDIFSNISQAQIKAAESSMIYTEKNIITDRKAKLLNKLILYKTSEGNYGIMRVTAVDNTSEGGAGHITFDYKTFNSNGSIKKSDNGKKVVGTFDFDLDSASAADATKDFWLHNSTTPNFDPKNGAKFYVL